jgi:hypothetical protein
MQEHQSIIALEYLPTGMTRVGEEPQLYRAIGQRFDYFSPLRRTNARAWKMYRYPDYCDHHGLTHFRTKTGHCMACNTKPPSLRALARARSEKTYSLKCTTHGMTQAYTGNGKCINCFASNGLQRLGRTPNRARIAARAAGQSTYMLGCALHGDTPHNVVTGKCLICFTVSGTVRKVLNIKC